VTEEVKEKVGLTQDSTIAELFEALHKPDGGANVRPITLQETDDDTRMVVIIRGSHEVASFVMAEVMSHVQDLFDAQEQAEASPIIRA
jgi:hypothetical protein